MSCRGVGLNPCNIYIHNRPCLLHWSPGVGITPMLWSRHNSRLNFTPLKPFGHLFLAIIISTSSSPSTQPVAVVAASATVPDTLQCVLWCASCNGCSIVPCGHSILHQRHCTLSAMDSSCPICDTNTKWFYACFINIVFKHLWRLFCF